MPASELRPLSWFKERSNIRLDYDLEELRLLRDSLVKKQWVPLICGEDGTVYDGYRRLRAAKLDNRPAQLETIILKGEVTEAQVKQLQLETAMHRADLTPFEIYAAYLEWLKHNPGKGGKDLAAAVSRSEASVSMTLSLSKCIKMVQDAARAKQIGLKDWYQLSQLPQDQQEAALMARLRGESVADAKRAARGSNGVKIAKGKFAMPSGVTVTLAGEGDGLTLGEMIEELSLLVKEMKRADEQGIDSKTFACVMRDKARK
jgi:ParB-like chromosome segregation protein Spo0J